ncbi:MAG: aminopeptidase P family protein [Chloroflexi bacterium]|nr:aminopeptidase P family protein [Chloroflexota bacterium]
MKTDNRLQKLRQRMAEKELNGIFISHPENRRYLSLFDGSAGYLFITQQKAILATDFRYIEQAEKQASGYEIFRVTGQMPEWFPKLLGDFNLNILGFESGEVTFALYRQLTEILSKIESKLKLVPTDGIVETLRAVKEPEEIEMITQAARLSDAAADYISGEIREGMTEIELAWELEKFMRERGSQAMPFEIIIASGPNGAMAHHKPSEYAIKAGEPVILDLGARCGGYTSDLTRTVWLGAPDDKLKKVYDIVLGAQLTALAVIQEGMTGAEADNLARTVIQEAGYAEAFGHGLGHGVGLATHELPRVGAGSPDKLENGMVFTIEPGIYLSGWGGVRIEDMVVMENGKARAISGARKTQK